MQEKNNRRLLHSLSCSDPTQAPRGGGSPPWPQTPVACLAGLVWKSIEKWKRKQIWSARSKVFMLTTVVFNQYSWLTICIILRGYLSRGNIFQGEILSKIFLYKRLSMHPSDVLRVMLTAIHRNVDQWKWYIIHNTCMRITFNLKTLATQLTLPFSRFYHFKILKVARSLLKNEKFFQLYEIQDLVRQLNF